MIKAPAGEIWQGFFLSVILEFSGEICILGKRVEKGKNFVYTDKKSFRFFPGGIK